MDGNNHTERLSSVERFDISLNQWFMVRPIHRTRSDAGAATLGGKIYIVGGFDGVAPTSTAEVFAAGTGRQWPRMTCCSWWAVGLA